MENKNAPCFCCNKRATGCHGKCEEYQEFVMVRREKNRRIKEEKYANYMFPRSHETKFVYR